MELLLEIEIKEGMRERIKWGGGGEGKKLNGFGTGCILCNN